MHFPPTRIYTNPGSSLPHMKIQTCYRTVGRLYTLHCVRGTNNAGDVEIIQVAEESKCVNKSPEQSKGSQREAPRTLQRRPARPMESAEYYKNKPQKTLILHTRVTLAIRPTTRHRG